MELGIFAKTFARPTLEGALDAVASHGLTIVQFNLSCVGLPTLPDAEVDPALCERIAGALADRGLLMAAVSGTFNMAHPDEAVRIEGVRRLGHLAAACKGLGTRIITLCTGSRDAADMWRRHSENDSAEAWAALIGSLGPALEAAEAHDVVLAFEPEGANVIDDSRKARRLLDRFGSRRLKVVLDPANLHPDGPGVRPGRVLEEAFALLGRNIVLAHAKERGADGASGHLAAGSGVVDFERYLRLLDRYVPEAPLILHGLGEDQVAASINHLRGLIAAVDGGAS